MHSNNSICHYYHISYQIQVYRRVDEDYPDDDSDNDDDDGSNNNGTTIIKHIVSAGILVASKDSDGEHYQQFLWLYTIFTYVFTFVTVYFLFKQTNRIISMRQKYLGSQNSVTDRTVKYQGYQDHYEMKWHSHGTLTV